jgi:hypothetical protein
MNWKLSFFAICRKLIENIFFVQLFVIEKGTLGGEVHLLRGKFDREEYQN